MTEYTYFRVECLRKRWINAEKCSEFGGTGESNEPTLPNGCSILVDHGRKYSSTVIFAVRTGDGVTVKLAKRTDNGTWMLASDQDAWEAMPTPADAAAIS